MNDDLVKRLRDVGKNYDLARGVHIDIRQAANRIEELEAKLKWVLEERDTTFAFMLKRAETAEAKLLKAMTFLDDLYQHQSYETNELLGLITYLEGETK